MDDRSSDLQRETGRRPPPMDNIIIFTVHKAASMVLHNLLMQVTAVTKINYYSPNLPETPLIFPPAKHNWDTASTTHLARLSGYIGPIRRPIDILNPGQCRIILHLRDPRDVLTSLFFSHCYGRFGFETRANEREEWIHEFAVSSGDITKHKRKVGPEIAGKSFGWRPSILSTRNSAAA
jgi:hypothetical protein